MMERTKLLYGVKDLKRMISKSRHSKKAFHAAGFGEEEDKYKAKKNVINDNLEDLDCYSKFLHWKNNLRTDNFIIRMDSGWKAIFDTSILIVIGYSCFTTVFHVSFGNNIPEVLKIIDYGVTATFFMDFLFNFFQEYIDKETHHVIRDHKKIALNYMKSGWMFLDFVATFPFEIFYDDNVSFTRMIRLTRLSKLISLFDSSKFKKIIKSYFDNSTRADRI